MSKIALHGLNVIPGADSGNGVGMPLWHNKDKSENPCVARSWRFVLILFPLKNGLGMGSTGGGDNQGLHLKDKFFQTDKEAKNGFLGYHNELALRLHYDMSGNLAGANDVDKVLEVGNLLVGELIQQAGDVGFQRAAVL